MLAKVEAGEVIVADDLYHISEHSHPGVQVSWALSFMPAYNGSLDAAQALHKAVLPEWGWQMDDCSEVSVDKKKRRIFGYNHKGNAARAWLICIIKALIAEEE